MFFDEAATGLILIDRLRAPGLDLPTSISAKHLSSYEAAGNKYANVL